MTTQDLEDDTPRYARIGAAAVSVLLFLLSTPFIADYVEKRARVALKPDIAPEEVKLTELSMSQTQPNTPWHMSGYITNTSPKYTLTSMKVKIEARDFPTDVDTRATPPTDDEAPIAGIGDLSAALLEIRPGEKQAFETFVAVKEVPHLPPRGKLGWHYKVISAEGRLDQPPK